MERVLRDSGRILCAQATLQAMDRLVCPAAGVAQPIDFGGRRIAGYGAAQRAVDDATAAAKRWPSLRLEAAEITQSSGASRDLIRVGGLLPISFRGAVYNIPVHVWLPLGYPVNPCLGFVVPTADMSVVPGHMHVGLNGMCYFPYCNE